MNINKKIFLIIKIILIIIIFGSLICFFMTKKNKLGNNMNSQEIVDYILNINSYKSNIEVTVKSNKNENQYILKQEFDGTKNIQEVIEPKNIAGIKIIRENENLKLENTNLNLTNIYNNYKGLEENYLDLSSFLSDYKEDNKSNFEQKENEIIMKATKKNNKYIEKKILYIDIKTKKPNKLFIQDNNNKTKVFIKYNEIELN